MPVLLLTLDGAVGSVPAAVVHGLLFTVVALGRTNEMGLSPWQDPPSPAHQRSPVPAHTSTWGHLSHMLSEAAVFSTSAQCLPIFHSLDYCSSKNHLSLKKTHVSEWWTDTFQPHSAGTSFTLHLCNSTLIYVLKSYNKSTGAAGMNRLYTGWEIGASEVSL